MNTVKKDPASDIFGAVLAFENVTNRLVRIERMVRLMAASQVLSEQDGDAFEGMADLIESCSAETVKYQDEFSALSRSYMQEAAL
ncbi:hypothetical protein [Croceicoccus marinus]|uniref:Uncharacterized protein n=1 Tax=Croceicoccus marinus TaxID=450378 RepID=A0A1Z1FA46_9SPHN|nr:hypothetical protein [Croceicoccus marinus]ARU15622.1 hypothetical protein A9D14_04800 [Croceicoccus marinus]QNE04468.1 hypothetical protein H4O24_10845 [Croceicoccus marinus]